MNADIMGIIETISERGKRNDSGSGVYKDGLLHCSVCGEKLETEITLIVAGTRKVKKVNCECNCEREKREQENERLMRIEESANIKRLKAASLMDGKLADADFSKCDDGESKNLMLCKRYVKSFDKNFSCNQGLIFTGDVGTGKSFAAACIANELIQKGESVVMTSIVKLIDHMRKNDDEVMDIMRTARLVIFDDLGVERNTDYAVEKMYEIIDARYRSGKPMIITTNLKLMDMLNEKNMSYKRIYDRIFEICYPIEFSGPSYRMKKFRERHKEMKAILEND